MPYPAGMQTRSISIAPFFGTTGNALHGTIRVTAARSFIWAATNEVFLTDFPDERVIDATTITIELPVTDQAGFIDGAGNTISGWTYTVHYAISGGVYVEPVTFDLLSGVSVLPIVPDISKLVDGGIVNVPYPVVGPEGPQGPAGADGAAIDATTTTKGAVKLAGDLGGTADLPTVPGLAGKAATVHTHAQADVTNLVTDLAGKAATVHTHAQADVTNLVTDLAAKAPLASPGLTGTPTAPTAATATNTTQIATTAFVKAQGYATLASPVFTGDPTAPTPATADNDTSIATTAFVKAQGYAPLVSPALTGNPTAPTPTAGDNDTSIATTAFVTAADATLAATKANTTHTHAQADVTNLVTDLAAKAPLASPALTGVPTAPTAAPGTNTTQLATTAFVAAAGGGSSLGVGPVGLAAGGVRYSFVNTAISAVGNLPMVIAATQTPEFLAWRVPYARKIRAISINVTVVGDVGSVIKVWLYKADGTTGSAPNILHYDFGSAPGDAVATVVLTPGTPVALPAGDYGFILGSTAVTTAPNIRSSGAVMSDPGRTVDHMNSFGFAERTGTRATAIDPTLSAPASIAWVNSGSSGSRLYDVAGGKSPLIMVDLIPA